MRRDGTIAPGDRVYIPQSPAVLEKRHGDAISRSKPKPVAGLSGGDPGAIQAGFQTLAPARRADAGRRPDLHRPGRRRKSAPDRQADARLRGSLAGDRQAQPGRQHGIGRPGRDETAAAAGGSLGTTGRNMPARRAARRKPAGIG